MMEQQQFLSEASELIHELSKNLTQFRGSLSKIDQLASEVDKLKLFEEKVNLALTDSDNSDIQEVLTSIQTELATLKGSHENMMRLLKALPAMYFNSLSERIASLEESNGNSNFGQSKNLIEDVSARLHKLEEFTRYTKTLPSYNDQSSALQKVKLEVVEIKNKQIGFHSDLAKLEAQTSKDLSVLKKADLLSKDIKELKSQIADQGDIEHRLNSKIFNLHVFVITQIIVVVFLILVVIYKTKFKI